MSYHSRRMLTPGASRKRKEMEALQPSTSSKPLLPPTSVTRSVSLASSRGADHQPLSSNRLLAGYMAHEFLTKGTLFGQRFESKRSSKPADKEVEPPQGYAEVASLMRGGGAHIPGIVNPAQLARWIQM